MRENGFTTGGRTTMCNIMGITHTERHALAVPVAVAAVGASRRSALRQPLVVVGDDARELGGRWVQARLTRSITDTTRSITDTTRSITDTTQLLGANTAANHTPLTGR